MCVGLAGPPGCGKGTQGDLMGKELAIPHISSGDPLRRVHGDTGAAQVIERILAVVRGHDD